MPSAPFRWNRRRFLQTAGSTAALALAATHSKGFSSNAISGVSLVLDPSDEIANSAPIQWACSDLHLALKSRGVAVTRCQRIAEAKKSDLCILASGAERPPALRIAKALKSTVPSVPEALGLMTGAIDGRTVLLACGHDVRGLVYALLELSDRVQHADHPMDDLMQSEPLIEHPANRVRGVMRLFASDVEDKPWYNDREWWTQYLTMLATQRFNRFNLALGLGYDFLRQVTDAYFLFAYPFLLSVPGHSVRVPQLPDTERDGNLEMLKFIGEQTVARGMEFNLGLWMHGYEWINSPKANYTIEGLTPETHGPYCRDALRMLLQACPTISSITFRIHGESGVQEGSYSFWKTVFDGVASCGRTVRLDMHSKGMDQSMIDTAVATGQPVSISPKFWAEHMGMSYHQADIRELEWPKSGEHTGLMRLSTGERSFLRYGYGDLLLADRKWEVVYRIWPGTQRLLLWGDPVMAAAYSRAASFCGGSGAEIFEPLSFKGRRGTGIAGDRCAYADAALRPHWDWQKYAYTYRIWGRYLYDPDLSPKVWHRFLRSEFGQGEEALGEALSNASRIMPIITTAHDPSAANNAYWPELYSNHSMVDGNHPLLYSDTPAPKVFGNVSPLDPELFSRINEYAEELLQEQPSGKYSPLEVAQWIEDYADAALRHLLQADQKSSGQHTAAYRRMSIDIFLQAKLGYFFGAKFRSGVLLAIYEKTKDVRALQSSLDQYRKARSTWAELAEKANGVYMTDITVGEQPQLRGHWLDRLPAIDDDIALIRQKYESEPHSQDDPRAAKAVEAVLGRPRRTILPVRHKSPAQFLPGQSVSLALTLEQSVTSVRLYYRHVDQAERYLETEMEFHQGEYRAAISGSYTNSEYPLEYYFQIKPNPKDAFLYPGFAQALANQPYFVLGRA